MFTFLNSIILSALFAALIPLLIHLFNKQKTKKIKFSSLRFLKKLEKRRLKKVKIYQILLIIIRTLLIVMLVLAFARPTFSGAWNILQEPSANTTAVIILEDGLNRGSFPSHGSSSPCRPWRLVKGDKPNREGLASQAAAGSKLHGLSRR